MTSSLSRGPPASDLMIELLLKMLFWRAKGRPGIVKQKNRTKNKKKKKKSIKKREELVEKEDENVKKKDSGKISDVLEDQPYGTSDENILSFNRQQSEGKNADHTVVGENDLTDTLLPIEREDILI